MFGPNEYHKGEMMSLVAKRFDDAKAGTPIRLFKSHRAGIADGDQKRDFIYVKDAVEMTIHLEDAIGFGSDALDAMTKSLRAGKVFLDWSQNNAAKTTIANKREMQAIVKTTI